MDLRFQVAKDPYWVPLGKLFQVSGTSPQVSLSFSVNPKPLLLFEGEHSPQVFLQSVEAQVSSKNCLSHWNQTSEATEIQSQ